MKKELFEKSINNLDGCDQEEWESYCKKTWSESKVLVGIPNTGFIEDMTGESPFKCFMLLAMYMASNIESSKWGFATISRMITHEARNSLAKQAIQQGYTHLCMIDSDHTFDKDIIHRLLLYRKDIIGVRAYKRTSPHYPCIFAKNPQLPDKDAMTFADVANMGVMIADAVGFGIILINVEVFKKLSYPYFYFSKTGEDFNFCREAQEVGYKIYVDTDVEIGHVSTKIVKRADFQRELADGTIGQFTQDMLQLIQEQNNDNNVNFDKVTK